MGYFKTRTTYLINKYATPLVFKITIIIIKFIKFFI